MLLVVSAAGLGFALYLAYIEAHVLGVWCILCLTSLTLISASAVLSAVLVAGTATGEPVTGSPTKPGSRL